MLKIKLQPTGKRHQKYYRVVVAEDRSKLTGSTVDNLGTYNPHLTPEKKLSINKENYQSWVNKGAQPTPTVRKLAEKLS